MMLNQDDFTLLDNGKPQKISVFAVKGTPSSRQAAVPLPPGTVSNRVTRNGQEAASSTVILIDRLNTQVPDQRYADQKIVKFLENRRSQDRIGIYAFGEGVRVVQDLTDDPDRLSRAINSLKPRDANHRTLYTPGPMEKQRTRNVGPRAGGVHVGHNRRSSDRHQESFGGDRPSSGAGSRPEESDLGNGQFPSAYTDRPRDQGLLTGYEGGRAGAQRRERGALRRGCTGSGLRGPHEAPRTLGPHCARTRHHEHPGRAYRRPGLLCRQRPG